MEVSGGVGIAAGFVEASAPLSLFGAARAFARTGASGVVLVSVDAGALPVVDGGWAVRARPMVGFGLQTQEVEGGAAYVRLVGGAEYAHVRRARPARRARRSRWSSG